MHKQLKMDAIVHVACDTSGKFKSILIGRRI